MEGGDLKTSNRHYRRGDLKTSNHRYRRGDLATTSRQYGGFLPLLRMLGLGAGVSPLELQKAMSDPIKSQMLMQRGGFPWALAEFSLLPMLMGRGWETE